jgi:mycothiol synthase
LSPSSSGAATLIRAARPSEFDALQAIWEESSLADDPTSGPSDSRGWSLSAWASEVRVLEVAGRAVGVVGVRADSTPDDAMPVRLALHPDARDRQNTRLLLDELATIVGIAGGSRARLFVPGGAAWLLSVLPEAGFARVRTIASMFLPADAPTPRLQPTESWQLRSIKPGEDSRVLAALNRAWAGTWNFVEITPEMLEADLVGQREGMLLGVIGGHIIATCHAMYEPHLRNPDGAPRAWISNLTVDPDYRGRGIARTMLAAGIHHLRDRGATSVTLGVDADDPAPFGLYRSVGFEVLTTFEAWDAPVTATDRRP